MSESANAETEAEDDVVPPDTDHETNLARVREGFDLPVDHEYTLVVEPWEVLGCSAVPGMTFRFGNSFVHQRAAESLPEVAEVWGKHEAKGKLIAFGHTDKVGSDSANWDLSERRAKSIVALIQRDVDAWVEIDNAESWELDVVQTCLLQLGHPPGPVDGQDGPKTQAAVKAFQEKKGLDVDGIAGPDTRKALYTDYQASFETGIAAEAFMDPAFLGVGEKAPVVETEEACEDNRRVTFFVFRSNRLPKLPDLHDREGEWYAKIAEACKCGDPEVIPTPVTPGHPDDPKGPGPPVVDEFEFAIRGSDNGDPPARLNESVQLMAVSEPPLEGTYRWSTTHPRASIEGEGQQITVKLAPEDPNSGGGSGGGSGDENASDEEQDVPVLCEFESDTGDYRSAEHVLQLEPPKLVVAEVSFLDDADCPLPQDLVLELTGGATSLSANATALDGYVTFVFEGLEEGAKYTLVGRGGGREQELFKDVEMVDADGDRHVPLFAVWGGEHPEDPEGEGEADHGPQGEVTTAHMAELRQLLADENA